jgi:hypothetical protein
MAMPELDFVEDVVIMRLLLMRTLIVGSVVPVCAMLVITQQSQVVERSEMVITVPLSMIVEAIVVLGPRLVVLPHRIV